MEGITIREHLATLEDPRVECTKRHQLLDLITIALCAVICGADTWVDIEAWGLAKQAWLEMFLVLPKFLRLLPTERGEWHISVTGSASCLVIDVGHMGGIEKSQHIFFPGALT